MPVKPSRTGPLAGFRIVELGGIGPGPFCGMLLADLGATVIRVDRPQDAGAASPHPVLHRSRRSVALDLKSSAGLGAALALIDRADAVIEGFRPGVAERLGVGPQPCLQRNRRLVYGRMTGWGQSGPMCQEPGHDINYIGLAGALGAMGQPGQPPPVPLNLIGDMGGGGMLLALGITAALLHARASGEGQVVDAAMTDGTAIQLAFVFGLMARGRWVEERGVNAFDGGAPFYRTYRCADDRYVAVGCVEPEFYRAMLRVLGLADDPVFAKQRDRAAWPAMVERLAAVFATRRRDEWAFTFEGQNACVTAVLGLAEAAGHPQNRSRETFITVSDRIEPAPAPRFSGTPAAAPTPAPVIGADTEHVLRELGIDWCEMGAEPSR
jgi:alpha-methylacyl-CoA racemase